jgi:tRNA (adenine-N(1)-)-methyltransferase non-catalytic subunit
MIEPNEIENSIPNNYFTHVISVGDFDFQEIADNVYPKMAGGANFIAFAQNSELIGNLYHNMLETKKFVFARMYDSFFREHQILPNRTHPKVNMPGFSGYVLHGFKS